MGDPNQPRDSRGRFGKTGSVGAVAIALAVGAMSVGGTGAGVGAGSGIGSGSAISQSLRSKVSSGKSNARGGRPDAAWRDLGLKRIRRTVRQGVPCAVNSYGEVQRFFARTPCRSLDRVLFVLDDGAGNSMVVSVSWVRMRGTRPAADLKRLADEPRTGTWRRCRERWCRQVTSGGPG